MSTLKPALAFIAAALTAAASTGLAGSDPGARIVSPVDGQPVHGKVSVETIVDPPAGAMALKVEVFVDGRLLATLLDAPFQTAWDAGDGTDPHVIRVKAYCSDGSVAAAQIATVPMMGVQKTRVLLVEVYATVKDEDGRFVTDLPQSAFTLKEDGVAQRLSLFTSERKPVKVLLLLDVSASMKAEERLSTAIEAARVFVSALEPADRVALVTFSDEAKVLEPFTGDRARVLAAIDGSQPERGTALYDAIFAAAGMLGREEGRRALVLLSDGQDNSFDGIGPGSLRTFEEAVAETLRHQVTAYTIGLGENLGADWDFNRRHSALEVLTRLASDTGGKFFEVRNPSRLHGAFDRVLEELRFQYTLGYSPTNERRDGGWRAIDVAVGKPRLTVTARKGYYAPAE